MQEKTDSKQHDYHLGMYWTHTDTLRDEAGASEPKGKGILKPLRRKKALTALAIRAFLI